MNLTNDPTRCSRCCGELDAEGWCPNYCTDEDPVPIPAGGIDELIKEWEKSADAQIEAALRSDLEAKELRRELARVHPHLSDAEIDEMAKQLGADLRRVRGSC